MSDSNATQVWNPVTYERSARFVSDLGGDVLALLDPRPGERILDLGCGDGALTERIAASGARVTGVDASEAFVDAARARGLDVRVANGERLTFAGAFDAVFSNAALHWMRDPDAVLHGVHRALVPRGRFVAEMGGHGNVAAIRTALAAVLARYGIDAPAVSPWYFPTAAAYRARLEAAGFEVQTIAIHPRPTVLPGDLGAWLDTFAQPFVASLAPALRGVVRDATVALVRPILFDGDRWITDYVRLRFAALRRD
jgi:trans-aconitate methyltransferase